MLIFVHLGRKRDWSPVSRLFESFPSSFHRIETTKHYNILQLIHHKSIHDHLYRYFLMVEIYFQILDVARLSLRLADVLLFT